MMPNGATGVFIEAAALATPGHSADLGDNTVKKADTLGGTAPCAREVHMHEQHAVAVKPERQRRQVGERAHKQTGGHDNEHRECYLNHHQRVREPHA